MSDGSPSNPHLIEELEQYRRLLDNIPAEIGVFDAQGRFLFNTPSGIRDAATREWVLGRTHHDWCRRRGHSLAVAERRQQAIQACVRDKRSVRLEEVWRDRQDGRPRHYLRTFSPVPDQRGEVTHVIGFGEEVTPLKKAEEEVRAALAEVAALKERLAAENAYLRQEIRDHHNAGRILGASEAMVKVRQDVATVGPTDAHVVVHGETGTGKELVARALHAASRRAARPLIKVNCAAVPRELFESEFFGHVKGAFTGALRDRAGRFELAHGGTLFLDEVGEIPLDLQAKLLRVLQEGEFERVGDERSRRVDVRVIAATNRDLRGEVAAGRFREDLYYRLSVFPIEVPPLRRRGADVALLARHYLAQAARKGGRAVPEMGEAELDALRRYDWPGNVRELQNVVERAVITSRGGRVTFDVPGGGGEVASATGSRPGVEKGVVPDEEMEREARENVERALRQAHGRVYGPRGAAALLRIRPTTLASRIKRWGLEVGEGPRKAVT